jgi:lysophospholipase L1-like esterase
LSKAGNETLSTSPGRVHVRRISLIAGPLAVLLGLLLAGVLDFASPTLSAPPPSASSEPAPPPVPVPREVPAKPPSLVRDGRIAPPSPRQLASFHKRLADLGAGRIRRVTILQIGDSHTQAEHFSGRLRARLQARFGDGGRGMLPPGQPYDYWKPYQVQAKQSGAWEVLTSNKKDHAPLPYGLSGFVLRSGDPANVIVLEAREEGAPFAVVEVGYYRKPGGGTIDLSVDGSAVGSIQTRGPGYTWERRSFTLPAPGRRVELRPKGDGSVDLADWAVYGKSRGLVLASFGFSGAQVGIMERWDWKTVRAQLAALDPALILLAFGTNEGYAPRSRLGDYEARLEARIAALRRAAPNASIVLVSGPDANRIPKYCNGSGNGRADGKTPNGKAANDKSKASGAGRETCRPLSEQEAAGYDAMLARSDRALCRWHTPASYALVRKAQRNVAARTGVYFWDWFQLQGGACGAHRWEQAGLVLGDRVHLKREGYWHSADRLYAALMRGFKGR